MAGKGYQWELAESGDPAQGDAPWAPAAAGSPQPGLPTAQQVRMILEFVLVAVCGVVALLAMALAAYVASFGPDAGPPAYIEGFHHGRNVVWGWCAAIALVSGIDAIRLAIRGGRAGRERSSGPGRG